jgi:type IV secretion system protein VirB8
MSSSTISHGAASSDESTSPEVFREAFRTGNPDEKLDPGEAFAEANRYDRDRRKLQSKITKLAIWWAAISSLVTVAAVYFAAARPPSVERVPYVAWIDPSTGIYTNVSRVAEGPTLYNEKVNKYWVMQYIQCREGWMYFTYNIEWEKCAPLSSRELLPDLQALYDADGPRSYFKRYGKTGSVVVNVTRVVPNDKEPDKFEVHFTLTETINGTVSPPSFWASQVKIQFSSKHSNEKYNPLGMQVINYRRDQETVQ